MSAIDAAFEEPLLDLRRQIGELERFEDSAHERELDRLRSTLRKRTEEIYKNLSRWQKALVARHFDRPYTLDYVAALMTDWVELHGDRRYSDDPAIVTGLAGFGGRSVAIVGHQKGRGTKERIRRNFGQPRPEGYRKALRLMRLAERFGLPVLCFIDTPGAYPGIGAEERGQAEAIATNLEAMSLLEVPIVAVITGEGGSGGALAIGVADRVYMLEYSIYSVISPEGCAAILWKDQEMKAAAAEAMRVTASDLLSLGVIEGIVPEPLGGAHADPAEIFRRVGAVLDKALRQLEEKPLQRLLSERYDRYRRLGALLEA